MAAALSLGVAATACAQYREQAVVAPYDRSTGPTVPDSADTRAQDQMTQVSPSTNNGLTGSEANDLGYGHWRTSDGLNSDADNPSGAPGPGTITGTGRSGI
jgi:hypothetical protein